MLPEVLKGKFTNSQILNLTESCENLDSTKQLEEDLMVAFTAIGLIDLIQKMDHITKDFQLHKHYEDSLRK